MSQMSHCVICDAKPGECNHKGLRYLDDVVYEKAPAGGWIVPEQDKERFWHPPVIAKAATPARMAADLKDLCVALGQHINMNRDLDELIKTKYDHDPLAVTREVEGLVRKFEAGQVTSPAGLFVVVMRGLDG